MPYTSALTALAAVAFVIAAQPAAGQEITPASRVQPYVFVAPGGVSNGGTTLHLGGGADVLIWKGLGASFEGGYLGPVESMDYGIGVLSTNAFYQFGRPARRHATPFVTGGYSLGFRSASINAVNLGGGVNYWLSDGLGLRVELRDHMPVIQGGVRDEHLWGLRIGLTWR